MSVESYKTAGNSAFSEGRYDHAITSFTEAIKAMDAETKGSEVHPQAAALYSNRAACYLKVDKYLEALHDADKCIAAKPDWWKGHCRKAYALEGLEQYEDCEQSLKESLALDDNNDEVKTKLRHVSAVVKQQKSDATKPNSGTATGKSKKNSVSAPMAPPSLVYRNWRDTANSNSKEVAPTEGSRKGQKLLRRPTILDVFPTQPSHPMFFPAEPKWPYDADTFFAKYYSALTDPTGAAPPAQETKFLVNLSATSYLNQKRADEAYRKSKKIVPECAFCGIELKMKEPPCCECGEPFCSRQCMELGYKDHKPICEKIREQSESLSMFHQLYFDGCLYGAIPWAGERIKNYSSFYYEKRAELKSKKAVSEGSSTSSSSVQVANKKKAKPVDGTPADENDVEDIDELTYLLMHERSAIANLCTQLQNDMKEATAAGDTKERDAATEELCATMLELYLRMTYYDAKNDTPMRCQFKLMMAEMLSGVLAQFNLAVFVEPLDTAVKRFEPALLKGGLTTANLRKPAFK